MRAEAKVFHSLSGVLGSPQQHGIGTSGRSHCQLVQGQALSSGSQDPGPRGSGEPERCDGNFGDGEETVVIGDGTDDDDGLAGALLGGLLGGGGANNAGNGHRGAVDLGHIKAAEDNGVEFGVGTACSVEKILTVMLGRV